MTSEATYAVIMAGGSGTRFWPASRRARPKQLLPLAGAEPLIRETIGRLRTVCALSNILIATGRHLVKATLEVVPELKMNQLLVEPQARNTAPCLGWATAVIARRDPEAVIMALPADHHIRDVARFRKCLQAAVASARQGIITTIGIQPTHPETGYGYLEVAPADEGQAPAQSDDLVVRRVQRFIEKPDRQLAEQLVADGRHYWNAGMFFFRAGDMRDAIAKHLPDLDAALHQLDEAAAAGRELEELEAAFAAMPRISIDHGIMERIASIAMVAGDFGWNDIGSWRSAAEVAAQDEQGNSAPPASVLVDARGCHVVDLRRRTRANQPVIALVGVSDLVVVQTEDALLVVRRDQAQAVRQVVEVLKQRGDKRLL